MGLKQHPQGLIKNVNDDLRRLNKPIGKSSAVNSELSLDDIHLFPVLRSLTLVAGVDYPGSLNVDTQFSASLSLFG